MALVMKAALAANRDEEDLPPAAFQEPAPEPMALVMMPVTSPGIINPEPWQMVLVTDGSRRKWL